LIKTSLYESSIQPSQTKPGLVSIQPRFGLTNDSRTTDAGCQAIKHDEIKKCKLHGGALSWSVS